MKGCTPEPWVVHFKPPARDQDPDCPRSKSPHGSSQVGRDAGLETPQWEHENSQRVGECSSSVGGNE